MFTNITWGDYLLFILVLSCAYYLVIFYLYFRSSLMNFIFAKRKHAIDSDTGNIYNDSAWLTVKAEMLAYIEQAGNDKLSKKDILSSLREILKEYPAVNKSDYRATTENLIITLCASDCSIQLSDVELRELWD